MKTVTGTRTDASRRIERATAALGAWPRHSVKDATMNVKWAKAKKNEPVMNRTWLLGIRRRSPTRLRTSERRVWRGGRREAE